MAVPHPDTSGVFSFPQRLLFAVWMLPAAVVPAWPFLPGMSPAEALVQAFRLLGSGDSFSAFLFFLLAAPLFLGLPIVAWHLRLLISSSTSRFERGLACLMAGCSVAMTFTFTIVVTWMPLRTGVYSEARWSLVAIVALVAATVFFVRFRSLRADRNAMTTASMLLAYLVNSGVLLLILSTGRPEVGWWLTLIVAAGMTVQLCWMFFQVRSRRFSPGAVLRARPPQGPS